VRQVIPSHGELFKPPECVSTPDGLLVSALTHIVLDVSYHDVKQRSLLDIPETRDEVFETVLGAPQVMERIVSGKIHIVLF
jgi:protein CMS1